MASLPHSEMVPYVYIYIYGVSLLKAVYACGDLILGGRDQPAKRCPCQSSLVSTSWNSSAPRAMKKHAGRLPV